MSDLGLVRYLGYAELPEAAALQAAARGRSRREHLANGVHLIVVQSEDGSLVVGDSHHYGATPDPFAPDSVDELILDELRTRRGAAGAGGARALDRHLRLGTGPADAGRPPGGRACGWSTITSGTGASTSFAIAEEVDRRPDRRRTERRWTNRSRI